MRQVTCSEVEELNLSDRHVSYQGFCLILAGVKYDASCRSRDFSISDDNFNDSFHGIYWNGKSYACVDKFVLLLLLCAGW